MGYIVFFLCVFTAFQVNASDKIKSKVAKQRDIKSEPVVKPWLPVAFSQENDNLPVNYLGTNPKLFLEMFKSKVDNLKKGEFETSEEFAKRLDNKDKLLAPINTHDLYAFLIKRIDFSYDADTQSYKGKNYSCEIKSARAMCDVDIIDQVIDTYVGSNAFGAAFTVDRRRTHVFGLSIPSTNPVIGLSTVRTDVGGAERFSEYNYHILPIPIDKAKYLKDNKMQIGVLFVGRVIDTAVVSESGSITPTSGRPFDYARLTEGVPFDVKKVIYYVVQSGEILEKKEF